MLKIEIITTEKDNKQTSKGYGVSWHEELKSKEKIKFMKMQGCYGCKKRKNKKERERERREVSRQGQEMRSFGSGTIDESKANTTGGSRECSI